MNRGPVWLSLCLVYFLCYLSLPPTLLSFELAAEPEPSALVLSDRAREFGGFFRKKHNFAAVLASSRGVWSVTAENQEKSIRIQSSGYIAKLEYAFYIPLYTRFGYLIGSSLGFGYEQVREEAGSSLDSFSSQHLPGLLLGLAWNFSPQFRFVTAGETYLERFSNFSGIRFGSEELDKKIEMSLQAYIDHSVSVDFFYSAHWAWRASWHRRWLQYTAPQQAQGTPLGVKLTKRDDWLALGFAYHMF